MAQATRLATPKFGSTLRSLKSCGVASHETLWTIVASCSCAIDVTNAYSVTGQLTTTWAVYTSQEVMYDVAHCRDLIT